MEVLHPADDMCKIGARGSMPWSSLGQLWDVFFDFLIFWARFWSRGGLKMLMGGIALTTPSMSP